MIYQQTLSLNADTSPSYSALYYKKVFLLCSFYFNIITVYLEGKFSSLVYIFDYFFIGCVSVWSHFGHGY